MTSGHVSFWDYDRESEARCRRCGWTGVSGEHEDYYRDLLDIRCPECEKLIAIIAHPTEKETRKAAAAGNERAIAELESLDSRKAFLERAGQSELTEETTFPDLEGDELIIYWDFESHDQSDNWVVLRHGDTELAREIAYFEGIDRFQAIFDLLFNRYGHRFAELRPTEDSELYLFGDDITAATTVRKLNEWLAKTRAAR